MLIAVPDRFAHIFPSALSAAVWIQGRFDLCTNNAAIAFAH